MALGKLVPVDLREIWKNEARNFTKWLYINLDILNEQTGLDLTAVETEKRVGPFSADIFAKDRAGCLVIIENQLERTDHDHLLICQNLKVIRMQRIKLQESLEKQKFA